MIKIDEISGDQGYLFLMLSGFNFGSVRAQYIVARKLIGTTATQKSRLPKHELQDRIKILDEIQNEIDICANLVLSDSIESQHSDESLRAMNIKLWGIEHSYKLRQARLKLGI